ncbi:conserved oligomeric Golgi complex subunit 4 [Olea europaea subsp. europaea]|uniref:Conserved oligomeric Golgi complex subunit 4 n=1 Tax=Olea europaea subsp. europaea TaxID=158383 RepID=A0A8S0P6U3_OLEEU|nr:conserved oligomeric Golgi complex subunit 4 [Olea europaea subsp. europaea]
MAKAVDYIRELTNTDRSALGVTRHPKLSFPTYAVGKVSTNVRQLDLAQSQVNEALLRIDAIVDRLSCLDCVQKSLQSEYFESIASYIRPFLQIGAKFKDSSAYDQREQLLSYKKQLCFLPLAGYDTSLGLEEEGLQFKDIVLPIENNNEILRNLCGEDGIVYANYELHIECDSRGSIILKNYTEYRKLANLTSDINSYKSNLLSAGAEGPDSREVELYLEEILSLMQLGEDYT